MQALLGTTLALGARFVPDARLYKYGKFDRNEAQIVEPLLARQLQQAAETLATEYVEKKLDQDLPCVMAADAACARQFFEGFLPKAYRRALGGSELDDLLSMVVTPALTRDGFRPAIELGIEAALQSTAFLYHSELGDDASLAGVKTLTNAEIADALGFLITGSPADAELARAADLTSPDAREQHARRLLETPLARSQMHRMVKQWVGIDQVSDTLKSKTKFLNYQPQAFDQESNDFVDEVVFARKGDFRMLMGAAFTVGTSSLADTYGAPQPSVDPGLIDLSSVPRRGIFNLGAFLATNATLELPSPVKRGARFLTQALCIDPGDPNALKLNITLPPSNSSQTTRQRFEAHAQGACLGCHSMIDSVGFTFEHFSAVGAWEANEDDKPELPIDSSTTLSLPSDIPFAGQAVADSSELATLVSQSDAGRRCFARNLARFTSASYGDALEQAFLEEWKRLADSGEDSVQELLVAYVRSNLFVQRGAK